MIKDLEERLERACAASAAMAQQVAEQTHPIENRVFPIAFH